MTNQEFWNQLQTYAITQKQERIPPLILQANQDNLSLLVVSRDNILQSLNVDHKLFVHCVTSRNTQIPDGCRIVETELKGFFFQLIESGYSGICFIIDSMLIGIEWTDLFKPASSSRTFSAKRVKGTSSKAPVKSKKKKKAKKRQ